MTTPANEEGAKSGGRRRAVFQIVGTVVVLGLLVTFLPRDQLVEAFRRLPLEALGVALVIYLTLHLSGAFKWRLLLNSASAGLGMVTGVRCYYSGLFGSTFLPSIVGGDFVRGGLAIRLGASADGVVVGSVLDRTLDVIALASVAGVGTLLLPTVLPPESRSIFLGLAATMAGAGLIGAIAFYFTPARRFPMRARRILVRLRQRGRELSRSPKQVAAALAIGFSLQALLALMNGWIGSFIGIDVPLYVWLFVWPLAKVSALVPLTQGGIGVREAALAALFAPFGVPAAMAVAAGFAFQGVVIGGGLIAGLIAFLLGRVGAGPVAPNAAAGQGETG